jgi:tetratricopeptide (TPR) repeat protein
MPRLRAPLRLALPLWPLLAACAATHPPATPTQVAFEPQQIEVGPVDLELAGKNEEELFAIGQAALAAKDFERAAAAFDRLVDLHPGSRREAAALRASGVAHEQLAQWRLALERFRALEQKYPGPDAVEAAFGIAECHYHLDEAEAAAQVLAGLAARTGLPPGAQVRALTQLGIVELEEGRLDEAETHLRQAVSTWQAGRLEERLDDASAAQAQYYLGEVDRARFLAVSFDPSVDAPEKLARDLEARASLLLSAQEHYLGAIRTGSGDWAVASGYRIGELYDALHAAMVEAPAPPGLDAGQAEAYRAELRRKVRVLVVKAITAYEQTLAVAGQAGVENPYVAETRAALDRMKLALREVPDEDGPAGAPPGPAGEVPGTR